MNSVPYPSHQVLRSPAWKTLSRRSGYARSEGFADECRLFLVHPCRQRQGQLLWAMRWPSVEARVERQPSSTESCLS